MPLDRYVSHRESPSNREVRLYLSSQWDMSAERRALIELAVPALKRFCDDRRGVSCFAV